MVTVFLSLRLNFLQLGINPIVNGTWLWNARVQVMPNNSLLCAAADRGMPFSALRYSNF